MAPPSLPTKDVVLRTTETLVIAAAGGLALTAIGFPAGLVIG